MDELAILRGRVDSIDRDILELINIRRQAVSDIIGLKSKSGKGILDSKRENHIISNIRNSSIEIGISPDFAEDIFKRIISESYKNEYTGGYSKESTCEGGIVIIGGNGGMGKLFAGLFRQSGYNVRILEKTDWNNAPSILNNACLVIISVPIDVTVDVINKLSALPDKCILADFTSIKNKAYGGNAECA